MTDRTETFLAFARSIATGKAASSRPAMRRFTQAPFVCSKEADQGR
ncbi:hypothetical protein AB3G45_28715 [Shinella sp. S4-D37]